MLKHFRLIIILASILVLFASAAVSADSLSVGLGASWQSSPYKGHDDTFFPLPLVHYESNRFYVRGLEAGVNVWKDNVHELSFGLAYSALSFSSSKTSNRQLKALDRRRSTVNGYAQYVLHTNYGQVGAKLYHDVLGRSEAFSAEAYYRYPFIHRHGYFTPGVGLSWDSADKLDYYYGVSSKEARRSGLSRYSPDSGISPYLFFNSGLHLNKNLSLITTGKVTFLSSEIKDSPMVNEKQIFSASIGLSYRF